MNIIVNLLGKKSSAIKVPLFSKSKVAKISQKDDKITFSLPDGKHAYLTSKENSNFKNPPTVDYFHLAPNTEYLLSGEIIASGTVTKLWIIEYSKQTRLTEHKLPLKTGNLLFTWRTDAKFDKMCLAIRIHSTGSICLKKITLQGKTLNLISDKHTTYYQKPNNVLSGPEGNFKIPSVFFDPSGYRHYDQKHRDYYNKRKPEWYDIIIQQFKGFNSLLDVGCGPGLLIEALKSNGVPEVVGLERDIGFCKICEKKNLRVYNHDLNNPFPFLDSSIFDGIIIHHTLDYLATTAIRSVLRESFRVLKPGGCIAIYSRMDGQASGDDTRTIPLSKELIKLLINETTLKITSLKSHKKNIRVTAHKPEQSSYWQPNRITLSNRELYPWKKLGPILPPSINAWDNISNRDFTILTTSDKCEYLENGKLIAYYTGYRKSGDTIQRAVCRAISTDGYTWNRNPENPVVLCDEGLGVAAGSVIRHDDNEEYPYLMYYSLRGKSKNWEGVCIARSIDGINWVLNHNLVLSRKDFSDTGLLHLALADVVKLSNGKWLMHCEGWITKWNGWAVFQAISENGYHWQIKNKEPVLHPKAILWGSRHVANPKMLELNSGEYLLGFNAADDTLAFQLGLAVSKDATQWNEIKTNPVICTLKSQYRIESFFLTKDNLESGNQRVYYFSASSKRTEVHSQIELAEADKDSGWIPQGWNSSKSALYTIRNDKFVAAPGADHINMGATKKVEITEETQCSALIDFNGGINSYVCFSISSDILKKEFFLTGRGLLGFANSKVDSCCFQNSKLAVALRLINPLSNAAELQLQLWHDGKLEITHHTSLKFQPRRLEISICVPTGEPEVIIDHLDIWQPGCLLVDQIGDGQTYFGVNQEDHPLMPNIDKSKYLNDLNRSKIDRALVIPFGSSAKSDTLGQIIQIALEHKGRFFPMYRMRYQGNISFQKNQLELLWQKGLILGLKVHMGYPQEIPEEPILSWLEKRQMLTLWHITDKKQIDWLKYNVLSKYSFPVLLAHFGGYPNDWKRYNDCINILDQYPQVYLVTSAVWFKHYLHKAISDHPLQIIFGSDYPAIDQTAAIETIQQLPLPKKHKRLVLYENIRFITERVQTLRWKTLLNNNELLFPKTPETEEELNAQGFVIIDQNSLPKTEVAKAKEFWRQYEVKTWYKVDKPWTSLLANLVRDLKPKSILEFGSNVGRNLIHIQSEFPEIKCVGIDINPEAINFGKKSGLDLRVGDEKTLYKFNSGEFDLVFTVSVLDHIADINDVCKALLHCASKHIYCLEVTLPVEGKIIKHFDHKTGQVKDTTGASYSWFIDRYIQNHPKVLHIEKRPVYLHDAALGPYYYSYLGFLK